MPRRTLARRNALLTLAHEPWTLYEAPPGDQGAGGGGGAPKLNEHGYPDNTPHTEMSPEHQAAYWRYHSKKWETTAKSAPDAAELERLRAAEAELATRKAAELTETERLQKERDDAAALAATNAATAAAATAELLKLQVIAEKQLTPAHAAFITGTTREELESAADALKALTAPAGTTLPPPRVGGDRGSDVGGTKTVSAGADLYRERHAKN
jgi:hypothetical protein